MDENQREDRERRSSGDWAFQQKTPFARPIRVLSQSFFPRAHDESQDERTQGKLIFPQVYSSFTDRKKNPDIEEISEAKVPRSARRL